MGKWQPPIPSGALWCKPMRELGTAKALVEYCYDIVDRDGWCKFKLIEVADMMDEPYINLKRWWKVLQEANPKLKFFSEIKNRGVAGFEVRISERWIDRRILNARTESAEPRSTKEVSPVSPLGSGNKVLIDPDQAVFADAASAAPPKRASTPKTPDRTPERQAYLDRKQAIESAYVDELGYRPAAFGKEAKAARFLAEQSYTPDQVLRCLRHLQADDFYYGKHVSLQTVASQIGAFLKAKQPGAAVGRATQLPPVVQPQPRVDRDEMMRVAQTLDPIGNWKRKKDAESRAPFNGDGHDT